MDNQLLAHVGGEVLVVGALAFYFHKQNTELHQQIAILKNTCRELGSAVEELQDSISQIGMVLSGGAARTNPAPTPAPRRRYPSPPKPQRSKLGRVGTTATVKSGSDSSSSSSDEDGTLNDNDLDKELKNELEEMEKMRCDGDVCTIKV